MRKRGHSVGPERLEEMCFFTDGRTKLAGMLLICGEVAGELPYARSILGYRTCGRSRCRERTSREYGDGDCSDFHGTPSVVDWRYLNTTLVAPQWAEAAQSVHARARVDFRVPQPWSGQEMLGESALCLRDGARVHRYEPPSRVAAQRGFDAIPYERPFPHVRNEQRPETELDLARYRSRC
jgi:hypothetical protein